MHQPRSEQHPNLPSGEWEGIYKYPLPLQGLFEEGKMAFVMDFCNGGILGFGSDQVGGYTWKGRYDIDTMQCRITKSYTTHDIEYEGHIDDNGIWGFWLTGHDTFKGTFHIWPKGIDQEVVAMKKANALSAKKSLLTKI